MAIFGLLSFERFDALLLKVDQPFEDFDAFLLRVKSHDGLFEPFAHVLIGLLPLVQFFVFTLQGFKECRIFLSELFEFFIPDHAATLPDQSVIPQLPSPSE